MKIGVRIGALYLAMIPLTAGGVMAAGRMSQRPESFDGDHGRIATKGPHRSGLERSEKSGARPNATRKSRPAVVVTILQTKREKESARVLKQTLRMVWTGSNGHKCMDTLTLPSHWCVHDEETPRPETWRMERTHVLKLMIYASDYGTAEFSAPLFCRLNSSHCLSLTRDIRPYSFSNHGSFYLQGKHMYVWDAIHEGADDTSQHRYDLRTFVWRKGRYHLTSRQITHRAYSPFVAGAGPGEELDPAKDPLKEFGMRWHWGMLNHNVP